MRSAWMFLAALPLALALTGSSVHAQERHVVGDAELRAAVSGEAESQAADRSLIRSVLQRAEVREVADRYGMDLGALEGAVGTLSGSDLDRAAGQARAVQQELAGGQVISMNATTLIIVLLLVIAIALIVS